MKERPIIFSGPMVNAILWGRKTQTRRALKVSACHRFNVTEISGRWWYHDECQDPLDGNELRCPHGVGDRLWVREVWRAPDWYDDLPSRDIPPEDIDDPTGAGVTQRVWYECDFHTNRRLDVHYAGKKRSPMFMPRWASRITLEVVSVRVERLLSITEDDAISEGAPLADNPDCDPDDPCEDEPQTHRAGFLELWDKLNAKRGFPYHTNPWVWVIEFKRVSDR